MKKVIFMSGKHKAFTLAEVLITLGIIGVVASMTLPAIIQTHREKQTVVQLKKFYSVMSNAMLLAVDVNGPLENWGVASSANVGSDEGIAKSNDFKNKFISNLKPYLNVIKVCDFGDSTCETSDYEVVSLDGTPHTLASTKFVPHLVLSDGTTINHLWFQASGDDIYGEIYVDLNGVKAPNRLGEDIFVFGLNGIKFVPYGINMIDRFKGFSFDKLCQRKVKNRMNGYGCAGWVIYNENMDYLHCDDLSESGKHKCK